MRFSKSKQADVSSQKMDDMMDEIIAVTKRYGLVLTGVETLCIDRRPESSKDADGVYSNLISDDLLRITPVIDEGE